MKGQADACLMEVALRRGQSAHGEDEAAVHHAVYGAQTGVVRVNAMTLRCSSCAARTVWRVRLLLALMTVAVPATTVLLPR